MSKKQTIKMMADTSGDDWYDGMGEEVEKEDLEETEESEEFKPEEYE